MPLSFCLPLTPFERYMLADDTSRRPMTFLVRWRFQGRAERGPLTEAFHAAVAAHPFLTARIARRGLSHVWIDCAKIPTLDWAEDGAPICSLNGHRIDLRREPGIRAWARVGADSTEITMMMHHAATDGIGSLQFLADWLSAYAEAFSGKPITLRAPTVDDLRLRGKLDLAPPVPVTFKMGVQGVIWSLVEAFKFNFLRPFHLCCGALSGDESSSY